MNHCNFGTKLQPFLILTQYDPLFLWSNEQDDVMSWNFISNHIGTFLSITMT